MEKAPDSKSNQDLLQTILLAWKTWRKRAAAVCPKTGGAALVRQHV
jgi:hypothetical protein